MGPGMFDGIEKAANAMIAFCIFSLFVVWPLGIWKAIEIALWIFNHLRWEG